MAESLSKADVTGLLRRWREDGNADERLFGAVAGELRRVAVAYLRRERTDHTLEPTALVNEAYLRLVDNDPSWEGRDDGGSSRSRVGSFAGHDPP